MKKILLRFLAFLRFHLRPVLPQSIVNYCYHLPKAWVVSRLFGNPGQDLEVIGVTGTDGKTTTCLLIYHLLKTAHKKVAVVTTVEARLGRKRISTGFHVTSPSPWALQRFLRSLRSRKYRYLVLEATSHGLDQFRLFPLHPSIAVLTNLTPEHLDYHHNMERYLTAKLRLFRHARHAVVNKDLPVFSAINNRLPQVLFSTYSLSTESQLQPQEIRYLKDHTLFTLGGIEYEVPLTGEYNLYNTLAAIAAVLILGLSPSDIRRGLKSFPGVKGRLEPVANSRGLHLFIDFAHTPKALESVLVNLQAKKRQGQSLIVVFGAAGERDRTKRPQMGLIAATHADHLIITSEDPRSEDPSEIAHAILSGVPAIARDRTEIILDRQAAITRAVELGKPGDWIVACGKGHEESMNYDGATETPWSETAAFTHALTSLETNAV